MNTFLYVLVVIASYEMGKWLVRQVLENVSRKR